MRLSCLIFPLVLTLGLLSGCTTYQHSTQVQDGPGLEFKAAELGLFRDNQDKVLDQLYGMAMKGATTAEEAGGWDRVIDAGMDFADSKCESYIHALFRLNRDKKTVTSQIGLLGTATAGLMAAAESAAKEVAAAAVLFGLASSSVDNLASNLLYDLDPSSVRTLVKSLQSGFRANLQSGYDSRPAALRVIRAYAMLCVPANIEAEVNLAVKRATPETNQGDPGSGQPPEVSNAESAVSKFISNPDNSTELLKKFVKPDGVRFDDARRAQLEKFIRSKGLQTSITSFLRLGRFAQERAEAVQALKLK
jgi:hypothetical protein